MSRISSEPQALPNIKDEPKPKSVSTVDIALIKQKVGEIYKEAGNAFNLLSNMTMSLHSIEDKQPGGKWTEKEMEMLHDCLHRFAVDLNKLSQHIKSRTVSQIRTSLWKKAFEDAGIPVRQVSSTVTSHTSPQATLNMLNASENEEDIEDLTKDVKLEFEACND